MRIDRVIVAHAALLGALTACATASPLHVDGVRSQVIGSPLTAEDLLASLDDPQVTIGREWSAPEARVTEWLLTGSSTAGPARAGVVGASVRTFDAQGKTTALRIYVDVLTLRAQLGLAAVPEGMKIRAPAEHLDFGSGTHKIGDSLRENNNLQLADQVWAAMEKHDAAQALSFSADTYIYEDYAAPLPLDKSETQAMVGRFLKAVENFRLEKPVQFAAGEFVITEMSETMSLAGKPIRLHALDVKQIIDGRVVREWQYSNALELLGQLPKR